MTDKLRLQYLIEQYLDGTLTTDEQAELDRLRRSDVRLDIRLDSEAKLSDLFANYGEAGFAPGFENRVMARIGEVDQQVSTEFYSQLYKLFLRISAPAIGTMCLLMFVNISTAADDVPLLEALFGLPSEQPNLLALF